MIDLSIIVPVYNAEQYLDKMIESVQKQTFKNFELILVNDGSVDNSLKIMESYAMLDKRIKIIDQPNSGVSAARNAGIENATGKFIGFVDADDYIQPWYYEKLMEHQKSSIVISDYIECVDGKEIKKTFDFSDGSYIHPEIENTIIKAMFIGNNYSEKNTLMGTVWRAIFERKIILENGIRFNENIKIAEDLLFLLEAMMASNSVYVCKTLGYFYVRYPFTTLKKYRENCLAENEFYIKKIRTLCDKTEIIKNEKNRISFDLSVVILYQRVISNYYRKDAPKRIKASIIKNICLSMNSYFNNNAPQIKYLNKKRQLIYRLMKNNNVRILKLIYSLQR